MSFLCQNQGGSFFFFFLLEKVLKKFLEVHYFSKVLIKRIAKMMPCDLRWILYFRAEDFKDKADKSFELLDLYLRVFKPCDIWPDSLCMVEAFGKRREFLEAFLCEKVFFIDVRWYWDLGKSFLSACKPCEDNDGKRFVVLEELIEKWFDLCTNIALWNLIQKSLFAQVFLEELLKYWELVVLESSLESQLKEVLGVWLERGLTLFLLDQNSYLMAIDQQSELILKHFRINCAFKESFQAVWKMLARHGLLLQQPY